MKCCQANLFQDAAFKKAKESLQLQAPLLKLPTPSEQGTRTSTKRKTLEVEKVDPAVSPKGAKPFSKKLVKIVAKKSAAKKAKVVEVVPDSSIIEVEPLEEELDNIATLFNLVSKIDEQKKILSGVIEAQEALEAEDRRIAREYKQAKQLAAALMAKAKAKDAERKRLEAEIQKKKQADKAEDERIAEIEKRLEIKKGEKAQADKKRQQELENRKKEEEEKKKQEEQKREEERKEAEAIRRKAVQVVPREARLTKQIAVATVVSMQQVARPVVKVRTSIEATTPLVSMLFTLTFCFSYVFITNLFFLLQTPNMPEGLGDIDKLLEDVSLTFKQCQTPTKISSIPIPLEPLKDQLQVAIDQLKELLQKPVGLVLLDDSLVDQFH